MGGFSRERIAAIKEASSLLVEDILDTLGIEFTEKYHSYSGPCPVHNGRRHDAWSWHNERAVWKCFSHGCDQKYGTDIIGLIRGVRKISFMEAIKWLEDFGAGDLSEDEIKVLMDRKRNRDFIVSTKDKEEETTYPIESLEKLDWSWYLCDERGFPEDLVRLYHIGACNVNGRYMSNRVVIPCINRDGVIVGFTGRTLDKDWRLNKIPKWKHSKGKWAKINLFNAHRASDAIRETGVVILCEGPLDVLRLEQAGVRNGLAIFGKDLKAEQMGLLINLDVSKALIAFDNDEGGDLGARSANRLLETMFDVERIELPDGTNDLGDCEPDTIVDIFREHNVLIDEVSW